MAGKKKLPDEYVDCIRWMLMPGGGFSLRYVAKHFGISHTQVRRIAKGIQRKKGTSPASPSGTQFDPKLL